MKQFAIIGLGTFGVWVLEELLQVDVEVLIVDKDDSVISEYRNQVQAAYIADAIKEETINTIIPADIDAAIIDLGDRTEVSILVVNYLKKLGVRQIVAKAETDEHGEILRLVGATNVVFPNREAAKRIMPPLLSEAMFSYMPISDELVMAEVKIPEEHSGRSIAESELRAKLGLNVVAVKPGGVGEFVFVSPSHVLGPDDTFLVVGTNEAFSSFGQVVEEGRNRGVFRRFFRSRSG
jgi:trk system potassium uptake protein TrkA